MVNERTEFVDIREILARVTQHPMLKNVDLEQAIRYTAEFIGVVGCPKFYCDKQDDIHIEEFKGLLPCGLVAITQVKDKKTGFCMRSMTDTFKPREYNHHSEPAFKTQGNIIFTSFKTGDITISYKAIPVSKEGIPLLINNEVFLRALELYIKKRVFTMLYDMGTIAVAVLNNAQLEYAYAVVQCEKEFIMPSISEMQSITNMWNTLIMRPTRFDEGFAELGNREYLRQ